MSKEKEAPVYEDGYPAMRYRPSASPIGFEHKIFKSSAEEKELGSGWYKNPGDFGVEINPGKIPDSKILANKKAFESGSLNKSSPKVESTETAASAKSPGRQKKSAVSTEGDDA